ncbi:hypothetical protein [Burkholderia sp. FERM BP-3421]|jgi:hypothetical protein|uniref:hypothetical protein n=1 Tax=Burkholderia sp. FERM BP-3421 TaxID=1494466 RepID=UPI003FCEC73A
MSSDPITQAVLEALPNPRGGAVRVAEAALREAADAFERESSPAAPLGVAAAALRDAGWLAAHRFVVALSHAAPFAAADVSPMAFHAALRAFRLAVARHNLRELACSPVLFEHYHALRTQVARDLRTDTPHDALALAGRPVPPATLHTLPDHAFLHVRARFEQALLAVLRAPQAPPDAALDEIAACAAALSGPLPYDYWRLAGACAHALRVSGAAELKRFLARCNLLLGEQARGLRVASPVLVRETLALIWRDYALYGAAAEDADDVELLRDYGLTVDWHVAATQASETLWEADAARAERAALEDAPTRELGVVTVNAYAYEDFLQTADASMAELAGEIRAADAGTALRAADAAYRVGAAAGALGLGHLALLADALGLAWRRRALAGPPDAAGAAVVARAAEALRAALHKIAAGVAPSGLSTVCWSLADLLARPPAQA